MLLHKSSEYSDSVVKMIVKIEAVLLSESVLFVGKLSERHSRTLT